MIRLEYKLQILNQLRDDISLYDYVDAESQSDPNFFRWLFDEDFDNDFDFSMSDEQIEVFKTWKESLRIDELFKKFIIIKLPDSNPNGVLKMTIRKNFETCDYCECYHSSGNIVGCYTAGCYSLNNEDSTIHSDLLLAIEKNFNISIYDFFNERHGMTFSSIGEFIKLVIELNEETPVHESFNYSIINIDELKSFVNDWVDDNENHTSVKAWTFHNAYNFNSVVLDYNDLGHDADCEELDQDEQRKILAQYPGVPHPHFEGATYTEETDNYSFEFTRWATDPWICLIISL